MNNYYGLIFILVIIFIVYLKNKKNALIKKIIKNKKKYREEKLAMNEIIKNFIDKRCIVCTFDNQIVGTITDIKDNWVVLLKQGGTKDAINIDYITWIREYPKKIKKVNIN